MLALVTADVARDLDPDLQPFDAACRRVLGDDGVRVVSWDDPSVCWDSFDAVVVRSTWDYTERLEEFAAWTERVAQSSRLVNPSQAIRWSADKRYLDELGRLGVPVVPTMYVPPGQRAPVVEGLHVVKPAIGAGSVGARRCVDDEVAEQVAALHASGHTAMVQPYLELLDELGETALCFVPARGGTGLQFSHAFGKEAILTSVDVESDGLFAKEKISPRTPTAAEMALATAVLGAAALADFELSFARLDVAPVRGPDDEIAYAVLEVELIEPSFYFDVAPGAADLFAERLVSQLEPVGATR